MKNLKPKDPWKDPELLLTLVPIMALVLPADWKDYLVENRAAFAPLLGALTLRYGLRVAAILGTAKGKL